MNSTAVRKPYQGVVQILQFNWPQYVGAAVVLAGALAVLPFLHSAWRFAVLLAVIPSAFWLVSSLVVSHYVYDRFPLYDLRWITRTLGKTPAHWINIHCGFDETSGLLSAIFPEASRQVINIYDPAVMTEGSIDMAQGRNQDVAPSVEGHYDALGVSSNRFDAAFLLFAAHELRRHEQRVKLFQEVERVLVPGGDLVLMEHSRDAWNFLAFGPGFLHFFSPKAWLKAVSEAGLILSASFPMTQFIRVYHLRKPV